MTLKNKKFVKADNFEEDPVKEIRRIRDEITKQFPSRKEYLAYLKTQPSATELLKEIERKKAEAVKVNAKMPPAKIKKRDEGQKRAKI